MTAYEEWVDKVTDKRGVRPDDRPEVSVNWPTSVPTFSMETHTVVPSGGTLCHDAYEVLPAGEPTVVLRLAGVRIRGPLADLRLLLAAAVEILAEAEDLAATLRAQQSIREFTDLVAPRSAVTP